MKVFLAGNIGRDAAAAERLVQEGQELHIASEFQNPSLVRAATESEGRFYEIPDISDPRAVAEAVVASGADIFWDNQDEALANGVVDEVARQAPGILIASPDQESSRIEWDKFDCREIIDEIDREWGTAYNPRHVLVRTPEQAIEVMDSFERAGLEVAVKPRGLTGGKLVKVMGPHLSDHYAALNYTLGLLADSRYGDGVSLEEKIDGQEFTIQGITDGKTIVVPPGTYDYPYREDGDQGPGTGGMGSFTPPPGELLPFLTSEDYAEGVKVMQAVLRKQAERGRDFKGVLYGSFFKTPDGLKVVEFNARIGCPEGMNIMELLAEDTPLIDVLQRIATGDLSKDDVRFKRMASTAIYLVSPDYAYRGGNVYEFELDADELAAQGCRTYFAAAEQIGANRYRTVGASRTVALASRAATPWEAHDRILSAIQQSVKGPLQFRREIGDKEYIGKLAQKKR